MPNVPIRFPLTAAAGELKPGSPMKSLADRFRRWYEYERDCNAKSLEMLGSVPADRRSDPQFQKAVDRMAHAVDTDYIFWCNLTPIEPTAGGKD